MHPSQGKGGLGTGRTGVLRNRWCLWKFVVFQAYRLLPKLGSWDRLGDMQDLVRHPRMDGEC